MPALKKCLFLAVALAAAISLTAARPCAAETWIVNSTADDGTPGTLRNALYNASAGDIISITATGTIYLDPVTGPLMVNKNLTIIGPGRDNLTIDGGRLIGIQNGGGGTPVFWVSFDLAGPVPGVTASISGLTIAHGAYLYGGGIANGGTLTVEDCALTANYATQLGGAILNVGDLTLTGCTLSGNTVDPQGFGGGAILNVAPGVATSLAIENCTLNENSAPAGGAIYTVSTESAGAPGNATISIVGSTLSGNSVTAGFTVMGGAILQDCNSAGSVSTVTIDTSTLSDNSATSTASESYGGAIAQQSDADAASCTLIVTNSTLSGNFSSGYYYGWGGAIVSGQYTPEVTANCSVVVQNSTLEGNYASYAVGAVLNIGGPLTIDNSTVSGNLDGGGFVSGIQNSDGGTMTIKNTILANDPSGRNLGATFDSVTTSLGHNLSTDGGDDFLTEASDLIETDPLLGPLADNGGPTWTCALLPGSPAIDAGDSLDSLGNAVTADQRGITRPQGSANDIGAFEFEVTGNQAPVLDVSSAPATGVAGVPVAFTATATDPDAGDTLTFSLGSNAPTGAGIDPSTGEFTWTPSAGGTFTFDVTVTDAGGLFDTESVTINVSALFVSQASAVRNGRIVTVTVLFTNKTSSAVTGVSVTAATLAGINTNSRLPLLYGAIKPGASKQCKLQFKNVPAGQQTFTLNGTSSKGPFFSTQDANVP